MADVELDDDEFVVESPPPEATEAFQEQVHASWSFDRGAWVVPVTLSEAEGLDALASEWGLSVSDEARARIDALLSESSGEGDSGLRCEERISGELRDYQGPGIEFLVENERCLLADEMGLGKTIEALGAMEEVEAHPAVVACPRNALYKWVEEIEKWVPHRSYQVVESSSSELEDVDIWVTTWDLAKKLVRRFRSKNPRAFVGDEAHYIKNHDTQRAKGARMLAKGIPYRWLLTGTPVTKSPGDLSNPLVTLDRIDEFGGKWEFLEKYAKRTLYVGGERKTAYDGSKNEGELHEKLTRKGIMLRRTKDEELDLPDKERVRLPLEPSNREEYDRLKQENGVAFDTLPELWQAATEAKLPDVISWSEDVLESDESLVLYCRHLDVLKRLKAELSDYGAEAIHGEVTGQRRHEAEKRFQRGESKVMVSQIRAGAEAIELTAASNVGFVEMWWTPAKNEQCEDRVHRSGQDDPVTCWYLVGRDTIDEAMWETVQSRWKSMEKVTEGSVSVDEMKREVMERIA